MCNCIEQVNAKLAGDYNTHVNHSIPIRPGQIAQVFLDVTKADASKRGKPMPALANFCPFCGERYETAAPADEKGVVP